VACTLSRGGNKRRSITIFVNLTPDKKRRLLLVDDEPSILITLSALLNRHGYDVVSVGSVPQALAAIQTQNFDVHPPSREARVFHAMEGDVWLNTKQERLAEISGRLMHEVKFGGGLLGHLARGGEFHVKQAEVAPGYWELTLLYVNMQGKALFFKSINVQQNEIRGEYRKVPDDLTLTQALQILRQAR